MSSERRLARYAAPLAVSVLILVILLAKIDLSEFRRLAQRMEWSWMPVVVICIAAIVMLFSLRWWLLAGGRLGVRRALTTTAIGLAGNQVLPARGGDILRIVIAARDGHLTPHRSVSAMLVEKVLDLSAASFLGLAACVTIVHDQGRSPLRSTAMATAALVLIAAIGLLALARAGALASLTRRLARLTRMPARVYRHAYRPVFHLGKGARARALAVPAMLTVFMWVVVYCGYYRAAAAWIGMPLGFAESEILIFVAALGLALPAAPSGIGTFHAAIVSGFILMGRSTAEGIVLAVILHGTFFAGSLLFGLIAIAADPALFRRRASQRGHV
jgi:uncharacterized protein (TIRG00374 family)